ncbi:YozQ family protein [Bacillaceae bacterium S4-13-58]
MEKRQKVSQRDSDKVAETNYHPNQYRSEDDTEQGLAITHEQASDAYMEGEIQARIDRVENSGGLASEEGEPIPSKGFDE